MASLWLLFVVAARANDERGSVVVLAGLEGTGHHYWDDVKRSLRQRLPLTTPERKAAENAGLCWFLLGEARVPCPSCADDELYCEHIFGNSHDVYSRPLLVSGCSYPCGSPRPGDKHMLSSPDLPQFARELRHTGLKCLVVAVVRDPLATVRSSFFRRHAAESTFRATAFGLYLNLGYLDAQLRELESVLFVRYEFLISPSSSRGDSHNETVADLAAFAGMNGHLLPHFRYALERAREHHRRRLSSSSSHRLNGVNDVNGVAADPSSSSKTTRRHHRRGEEPRRSLLGGSAGPHGLISDQDRAYVSHLFFRPAARAWIPTFWPHLQFYAPRATQVVAPLLPSGMVRRQ